MKQRAVETSDDQAGRNFIASRIGHRLRSVGMTKPLSNGTESHGFDRLGLLNTRDRRVKSAARMDARLIAPRSSHEQPLAVGDTQHLLAVGTEIDIPTPQEAPDLVEPDLAEGFRATRTQWRNVVSGFQFNHHTSLGSPMLLSKRSCLPDMNTRDGRVSFQVFYPVSWIRKTATVSERSHRIEL